MIRINRILYLHDGNQAMIGRGGELYVYANNIFKNNTSNWRQSFNIMGGYMFMAIDW